MGALERIATNSCGYGSLEISGMPSGGCCGSWRTSAKNSSAPLGPIEAARLQGAIHRGIQRNGAERVRTLAMAG